MDAFLGWQVDVLQWIETWRNPVLDQLFLLLTRFGEEEIVIVFISWLYWNWNKVATVRATYAFSLVLLLNIGLKDLFDIPRPFDYDPSLTTAHEIYADEVEAGLGYAFPSGHSTIGAGWTTMIATLLKKKWIWIAAGVLMTLVGLSRLYLGVHYPLDVVFGLALGISVVIGGQKLFDRLPNPYVKYALPLLIFVPFAFFGLGEDFFKAYGLYLGFAIGVLLEQKYALLQPTEHVGKKWLRFVLGIILVLAIQQGLKVVFPEGDLVFATIRYGLVGLMLYAGAPATFKLLKI